MGRGSSKVGGSTGGGGAVQPKTQRDIQVDNLEQSIWRGSGRAMHPSQLDVGDRIEGIQYSFQPNVLAPTQKKGAWSGDYQGAAMSFKADNTFQVDSVVSKGNSTTITVTRVGGAGGTAKKTIPNDVYLRVYR